ncbi:hypothetical protein AX774_g5517 [Zancudomyces culisetae]|uniref:RlpA-like protein double-psi beta-barrel domain-containing protein n=1 Tax=Zancudomyces culisetae TaxID=1213189 RepID=A0A1R1PJD2_ZANCU|nr:hypothetical protein AX774_g5517 [Zancudomyces culisetae]|eukprot:OMH81033.1 hypothetical protein AX774_g5517 [Zancudomyces culisetae]
MASTSALDKQKNKENETIQPENENDSFPKFNIPPSPTHSHAAVYFLDSKNGNNTMAEYSKTSKQPFKINVQNKTLKKTNYSNSLVYVNNLGTFDRDIQDQEKFISTSDPTSKRSTFIGKLTNLIPLPNISGKYSPFRVPPVSSRLPKLYRNRATIITLLSLLLLSLIAVVIYLSIADANGACFGSCGDLGSSGLYLNGFGSAIPINENGGGDSEDDLSCNNQKSSDIFYVRLNSAQFLGVDKSAPPASAPVCGKCMLVAGPDGYVKAKIVGSCSKCSYGGIALSPLALSKINKANLPSVPVSWGSC